MLGASAVDSSEGARDEEFLEGTEPELMVAPDAGAAAGEAFDPAPSPPTEDVLDDAHPLFDDAPPF
jgi:hypothetical protein